MNQPCPDLAESKPIPDYPVRLGEVILIVLGAIALLGAGCVGLYLRVINYAYNPGRAEAVAKAIVDYDIPGGAEGIFGINIGSAKLALVRSVSNPPNVILFVAKNPITRDTEGVPGNLFTSDDMDQQFAVQSRRTETKTFCGAAIPITVEEGEQTFPNLDLSLPAVRYTASLIEEDVERTAVIVANGDRRYELIESSFSSLRCR